MMKLPSQNDSSDGFCWRCRLDGIAVMYRSESEKEDEYYKLIQKGFYVEPPSKYINFDTIVENGSDFIHRSKLEDANLKFALDDNVNMPKRSESMSQWGRTQAEEFSRFANNFLTKKQQLKNEFPKVIDIPRRDEKDWCLFCHGSQLCSIIYKEEQSVFLEGQQPVLSIILHLSQQEVKLLLRFHYRWFQIVGVDDSIGKWVYALLSCLEKPLTDGYTKLLELFYNDCRAALKTCEKSKKRELHFISAVLENYFCVKSYKIGPSLERFAQ